MSPQEFLDWLVGPDGGAYLLTMAFVAIFLEKYVWWTSLPGDTKRNIILVVSVLVGLAGWAIKQSPELIAFLDGPFQVVYGIVTVWLVGQGAYHGLKATQSVAAAAKTFFASLATRATVVDGGSDHA